MTSSGLVKRIIRSAPSSLGTGVQQTLREVVRRAAEPVEEEDDRDKENDSSGLSVRLVIILLGSIVALWLLVVSVGILCKFFNKPRSAAHVGGYLTPQRMYQPSAATYGDKTSPAASAPGTPDPKGMYNSRSTLLDGASPMGRASMADTSSVSTPDVSSATLQPRDYFAGPSNSSPAGRPSGQHHRHTSSGVGLPGPSSAVRRGPSGQHPPMAAGPSFSDAFNAPDGGSFRPGQYINQAAQAVQGMSTPQPGQRTPRPNVGVARSNSKTLRGPPPARSNSKRKSRYSQMPRVESVGAGLARESRYVDDAEWEGHEHGGDHHARRPRHSMAQSVSRRSIFAGDRTRSVYGAGRMSVYGAGHGEADAVQRAQEEGFGSGTPVVGAGFQATGPGRPSGELDPLGAQPLRAGSQNSASGTRARSPMAQPAFASQPHSQYQPRGPSPSAASQHRSPPLMAAAGAARVSPMGDAGRAAYAASSGPFAPHSANRQPQLAGIPSGSGARQLL
ncbi:unnamed protein product [Parajaminaea phylloscopi]